MRAHGSRRSPERTGGVLTHIALVVAGEEARARAAASARSWSARSTALIEAACAAAAAACRPALRRWRASRRRSAAAAQQEGLAVGAAVGPLGELQRDRASTVRRSDIDVDRQRIGVVGQRRSTLGVSRSALRASLRRADRVRMMSWSFMRPPASFGGAAHRIGRGLERLDADALDACR